MRTTREGPQHGDPQGGSSEGIQRGKGRWPGHAGGSRGGDRYIKRGAAQKAEGGRCSYRKRVAVTGGRYRKRVTVTGDRYREQEAITGGRCWNNALRQDASTRTRWYQFLTGDWGSPITPTRSGGKRSAPPLRRTLRKNY